MYIYLIIALLFGGGAVSNFSSKPIDWPEASAGLAISLLMLLMFFWIRISHARSHRMLQWLLENKDLITDEPQYFRDAPVFGKAISKKTTLRSFKVVTSALFVTSMDDLGMELRTGIWAGIFATTWTLLFGWWGLPWGPIRTIQALAHNFSGGKTISVAGAIISSEIGWDFETDERR